MTRIGMSLMAAAVTLGAAAPAQAFWVARGWRGVAIGGIRAPLVAREAFMARCWRCAPALAAGAAAIGAGATVAAAGAGTAAAAAPAAAPASPAATAGPAPAAAPAHTQVAQAQGNSASNHCAAGLPADSRMIYDASLRNMKSLSTLRDTVVAETRSLVEAGRLNEAEARPAAERAGTCLRLLANQ